MDTEIIVRWHDVASPRMAVFFEASSAAHKVETLLLSGATMITVAQFN